MWGNSEKPRTDAVRSWFYASLFDLLKFYESRSFVPKSSVGLLPFSISRIAVFKDGLQMVIWGGQNPKYEVNFSCQNPKFEVTPPPWGRGAKPKNLGFFFFNGGGGIPRNTSDRLHSAIETTTNFSVFRSHFSMFHFGIILRGN